ncbi:MAG TPA: glycosyl hydrolase 115 family protein [Terriglobia bacterium]|nr:glycosyl hydrolase 115 family protein [Terriglobia bacterium]
MITRLLLCVFVLSLSCGTALAQITVNSQTAVLIDSREPGPIQQAASDLASDLSKVFGHSAQIVHQPSQASPVTIWIAFDYNLPKTVTKPAGWERFQIQSITNPWPGSPARRAIVLTGSDVRGAIYAIYQFSQQFLGVDPLYWWTDHPPKRQSQVSVPGHYAESQAPAFRYRGFFINDEDLLTGWRSGIPDGTDISLKTWNRVFEAILRLKGNMVIPGTWIFSYEPQIEAAVDRGLVVTQHHANVLGLDPYRWPKDKPYSFESAPGLLEAAWKRAIEDYPNNAEIVWSVGYRGQNDYPFWMVDKNAPSTPQGRAEVIQDAIGKEIEILRAQKPHAPIVLNAWAETARFLHDGFLKVPSGVTLVWPDDGHGTIRDQGEISAGEGEYYHTAMIDWRSNHFSELVPLERIRHELGRAAKAGATDYLIVNTSNLRPVVMTSRATMDLAWNPKPWIADRPDEASVYLNQWSREEFGEKAANAIDEYYRAYFRAPARYGEAEDARMGDQFYEIMSRFILVHLSKGDINAPFHQFGMRGGRTIVQFAAALENACSEAVPRWQKALELAEAARKLVAEDRQDFFQANILTQVEINLHGNKMLMDVAKAAQTASRGGQTPLIKSAVSEGEAIQEALKAADYGKWAGFYTDGDWLLDVPLTVNLEKAYIRQLEGHAMDKNVMIRAQDGGFAYYMITAYQGTQTVPF